MLKKPYFSMFLAIFNY